MTESLHFIQIILDDAIHHGRRPGIPKEFIRKYGDGLSSPVTLKIPNGTTWQVELLNHDDEVWFEKGWQEFAKYHRLEHGHLLMFKYEQPCQFYVVIFDKSATETEYPSRMISTADQNPDGGSKEPDSDVNEDNCRVEILYCPSPKVKGGEEHLSPPSVKRMRTVPTNKTADNAVSSSLLGNVRNNDSPSGGISIGNTFCRGNFSKRIHIKEASQSLEAANKHISEYPSFKSVVFVNLRRNIISMHAPYSFSRQHFREKVNDLTLQVADRSWSVRFLVFDRRGHNKFSAGLPVFAKENSLKQGDVCVFELIESGVLNVSIFRRDDYDASACSCDKEFGNLEKRMHKQDSFAEATKPLSPAPSRALDAATKYLSEYPSFMCTVPVHNKHVYIPSTFCHKYLKNNKIVRFQVRRRSWSLRLIKRIGHSARISGGWRTFAKENSLKERDVCVFELIEPGVLNVCIFRRDG